MSLAAIVAVGLATYGLRASLLVWSRVTTSARAERVLARIPAAVLPAMVVSIMTKHSAAVDFDARVVALLVAAATAAWTRSVTATLGVGLATLWGVRALWP